MALTAEDVVEDELYSHTLAVGLLLRVASIKDAEHVRAEVIQPGKTRLRQRQTYTFCVEHLSPVDEGAES